MSFRKYIDDEFSHDEKNNVLQTINRWLGGIELTPDLEQDPDYKPIIVGAINLMRHQAFEWIKLDDTSVTIADRWLKRHCIESKNQIQISYGIRFSTTEAKTITIGCFYSFIDNNGILKTEYHFIRYEIADNFMFKQKHSTNCHPFSHILRFSVHHINKEVYKTTGRKHTFEYHHMRPMTLNAFPIVIDKLDFYITEHHLTMNGYAVLLQDSDDEESGSEGRCEESGEESCEESCEETNQTKKPLSFKQGSKTWSYSQ